jgi:hypothetical protein
MERRSIQDSESLFEKRYGNRSIFRATSHTDIDNLDIRAFEFDVNTHDPASRRDFAKFMVLAIGLGYSQATNPVTILGTDGLSERSFIQVYLQRSAALDANEPQRFVPRARSGPKASAP